MQAGLTGALFFSYSPLEQPAFLVKNGVSVLDPLFARLYAATDAQSWEVPQLTIREKVFLCIVADVCNQTLGLPFEIHVRTAQQRGVSTDEIRDLLRCVAFESGYPAAMAAFERLALLERDVGALAVVSVTTPAADGGVPTGGPPPEVRAAWHSVDTGFGEFMELQSRMVGSVARLSVRERAFAAITCDALYQTLDETFRIHVGRALSGGAEPNDIRAVLRFGAQFGSPRSGTPSGRSTNASLRARLRRVRQVDASIIRGGGLWQ